MNNQELVTKIEEWVDANEEELVDDNYPEAFPVQAVESESLITFIKKLLHE